MLIISNQLSKMYFLNIHLDTQSTNTIFFNFIEKRENRVFCHYAHLKDNLS